MINCHLHGDLSWRSDWSGAVPSPAGVRRHMSSVIDRFQLCQLAAGEPAGKDKDIYLRTVSNGWSGSREGPPRPPTHPPWCYLYQSSRPGFTPTVLCWPLNPTWPLTSGITIDQLTVGWSIDSIYQAFGAKKNTLLIAVCTDEKWQSNNGVYIRILIYFCIDLFKVTVGSFVI